MAIVAGRFIPLEVSIDESQENAEYPLTIIKLHIKEGYRGAMSEYGHQNRSVWDDNPFGDTMFGGLFTRVKDDNYWDEFYKNNPILASAFTLN